MKKVYKSKKENFAGIPVWVLNFKPFGFMYGEGGVGLILNIHFDKPPRFMLRLPLYKWNHVRTVLEIRINYFICNGIKIQKWVNCN